MSYAIRPGTPEDGPAVLEVFNHFVEHSFAAYPRHPLPPGAMNEWIARTRQNKAHVVECDGRIVGFAMLKWVYPLDTFNRAGDVGYFLLPEHTGHGLGSRLLELLETDARELGITTLLASISSRNEQSLAFHESRGFRTVGRWERVGEKLGEVFDIVWMQKDLGN
jgi:L-amino acid N-acyltransferase